MFKNCVVESKKHFETAEEFVTWAEEHLGFSPEEATLVFRYVTDHGYCLYRVINGERYGDRVCAGLGEPENEPVAHCFEELITCVCRWNYELLLDDAVTGEMRESVERDAVVISNLQEWTGVRDGYCIGKPTVKELIAILNKLPQDYRVTCCGGENYLYRFEEGKYITIDCEWYLG